MKIRCNESLRQRAMAKAKGDYEAHAVSRCAIAYAIWCDEGNSDMAHWAEGRLDMFVNTSLGWNEACRAAEEEKRTKPHGNPKSVNLTGCPTSSDSRTGK